MENFKKKLMVRKSILQGYFGLIVVLIACLNTFTSHSENFQIGFIVGVALGTEILAAKFIAKYSAALKSQEKLKELYISENDERCKYIEAQIGSLGLNVVIAILALATIVSGFFSQTIFFSLLGAVLCSTLVKAFFKIYFRNKI